MNIYKLTYQNKEQAIADLESKGILTKGIYGNGVQAVVEIGLIILDIIDDQPIYADGYHYDIMSTETYDFGANLVEPKKPKHAFAGYPINEEVISLLNEN
jgi:translation elongation factor P/translation initiation factor 5A